MVAYNYDGNSILAESVKHTQAATLLEAWKIINEKIIKAEAQPNTYIMNNKISIDLKQAMKKTGTHYQLVPPNIYRAIKAERAI